MAIAVDDIRYLDGAAGGRAAQRARGAAADSALRRPGRPIGGRSGHVQRRRLAGLLALAAALAVVGVTPSLIGAVGAERHRAQVDGAVTVVQPRPVTLPAEPGRAGAGAVVIDAGQSVWEAVAPYTPENMSMHEWVASVLEHNDLDARAVRAGTLVRLP